MIAPLAKLVEIITGKTNHSLVETTITDLLMAWVVVPTLNGKTKVNNSEWP